MNLAADIGNSSTKIAIYEGGQKVSVFRISDLNCLELDRILNPGEIGRSIISSVRDIPEFVTDILMERVGEVLVLSGSTRLPFRLDYETPETLGPDRIAAVAGAFAINPGKNSLIIDAGSAITYDFLEGEIYRGGNISPGIIMRFRALNRFTARLPLTSPGEYEFPGRNTVSAIRAGVIEGAIYEINEYIRTFEEKHPGISIFLTGGDGSLIREKVKEKVIYLPDLVMDGLNYILEYNAK